MDATGATQTYEAEKAIDGRNDTAWRCPGDASGHTLTIAFGAPVRLTGVGLIPGFDKIDPADRADRFVQGRKIIRVRWTFDDGSSVDAVPNGERSMIVTNVSVRTSAVRLTVLQTTPGSAITSAAGTELPPADTSAVSEVSFSGLR